MAFASIICRLGRNRIPYSDGKTVEGTAVGLAAAFAACLIFVSPPIALIAGSIGMITELSIGLVVYGFVKMFKLGP